MKNTKNEIVLEFDLPDFSRNDIKVRLGKKAAAVKAEKTIEKKIKRKDFFHQEKSYRSFSYATTLPKEAVTGKAKTEFKKGRLRIKIPKK